MVCCFLLRFICTRALFISDITNAVSTQPITRTVMGVAGDILLSTPVSRSQLQRTEREIKRKHHAFNEKTHETYIKKVVESHFEHYRAPSLYKLRLFVFVLIPDIFLNRASQSQIRTCPFFRRQDWGYRNITSWGFRYFFIFDMCQS